MEIENFIKYLSLEKKSSPHTCDAYRRDLLQFLAFLREEFQCEEDFEISYSIIRSWVVSMVEKKYSARSINRKLSSLRAYFKYLIREGSLKTNPLARQSNLKENKRITVPYSKEEMENALDPGLYPDSYEGRRDRLMMQFFYGCGMRLSELTGIRVGDIDFSRDLVRITGKRNKQRLVPMYPELARQARDFIREENLFGKPSSPLFNQGNPKTARKDAKREADKKKDKKLTPQFVYRIINYYLSQVTDKVKKSPHVLRHTFATHILEEGADISSVKEILGHSSLVSTVTYTHQSLGKLKSVYNRAHPRQRDK